MTAKSKITASSVSPRAGGVSSRIHWVSSISPTEITSQEAEDAQAEAGYHPLGYGFFGFSCKPVDGGFQATWTCAASCD